MEQISLKDLDEVDLLLTEVDISQGRGNLILCVVASPAYRDKIIEAIKEGFSGKIQPAETCDNLIFALKSIQPDKNEILIWTSTRDAQQGYFGRSQQLSRAFL